MAGGLTARRREAAGVGFFPFIAVRTSDRQMRMQKEAGGARRYARDQAPGQPGGGRHITSLRPPPTAPMPDAHPCLYCGGTDFTVLHAGVEDRLRYAPGKRDWLRCKACGSAVLFPFPAVEEIPGFYPPVYTFGLKQDKSGGALQQAVAQVEFQAFYRPQYESQAQRIVRVTRVPRTGKMLDVGCGRGLRLLSFRRLGMDVHGMDLIPEPVEYVKHDLGVPAVCTDMAGLPAAFEPGTFDLVTAFQVIEHVPDTDEMLASCFALLRPGGWVV